MAQQSFKKGDRIDIGTGYQCDKGTFIRYEGNNVVWESDMGGEFKTPLSEYNINKSNKSTMEPKKIYTEEQVRDMLHEMKFKHNLTDEHIEYWIEDMTPIEVPSDEEIVKELFYQKQVMNPYPTIEYAYTAYEKGFMDCANLIIDKILNK